MNKIFASANETLVGVIRGGQTIAVNGFGLCDILEALIAALCDSGVKNLTYTSNNADVDGFGLGLPLETHQIKKTTSSYIGKSKGFERQYLADKLELEFTPQGMLTEKLRVDGAGVPVFSTETGVGTFVAGDRELHEFDGETYATEHSLVSDVVLVKTQVADKSGNLRFNLTVRNFNPATATAGKICIVEVEEIIEAGESAPDDIHLPGIYMHRIMLNAAPEKCIEKCAIRVVN